MEPVSPRKFYITLAVLPNGDVGWKVWKGISEPFELVGSGDGFCWAAATHQAGTLLMKLNKS